MKKPVFTEKGNLWIKRNKTYYCEWGYSSIPASTIHPSNLGDELMTERSDAKDPMADILQPIGINIVCQTNFLGVSNATVILHTTMFLAKK